MSPKMPMEIAWDEQYQDQRTLWEWRELAPDIQSKFTEVVPWFMVGLAPKGSRSNGNCPSCSGMNCDKNGCPVPDGIRPVDMIADMCERADVCPRVNEDGMCPDECPFFTLFVPEPTLERVVRFDLLRKLIAAGVDLKTWKPNEEED